MHQASVPPLYFHTRGFRYRMQMGTVVLVHAEGQDDAQGPSNEHLWAPWGKQEKPKCPSAHKRDI